MESFSRPLLLVSHPDDETIACSRLLIRAAAPLVLFATDGAAPGYGFETKYGSLKAYSDLRFQEASRALAFTPKASFKRLAKPDGSYFVTQHLFEDLPEAAVSIRAIIQSFSPDAIVSHAYEGGNIDHDACSFLAMHAAADLGLKRFEFPLYWLDEGEKPVIQQFRDVGSNAEAEAAEWQLQEAEILCKRKMLAEYQSQSGLASTFSVGTEPIRPATSNGISFSAAICRGYEYRSRRHSLLNYLYRHRRLRAKELLKKFAEFDAWHRKGYAVT